MKKIIFTSLVLFVVLAQGVFASSPRYEHSCTLTAGDGEYLIDLDHITILSNSSPSKIEKSVALPKGKYQVMLESFDGYDDRNNSDPDKQRFEQYYVQFKSGANIIASSGNTSDLEDGVKSAVWKGVVNEKLDINTDIDNIVVWHSKYPDSNPNSLQPICMLLKPIVVAPQCGSANNQTFSSRPDSNLCAIGEATENGETDVTWQWDCKNPPSGTWASCSAFKTVVVDGQCGSAHQQFFTEKPTDNLCAQGIATEVSGIGPWVWRCNSENGGEDVICVGNKEDISSPIDGGWTNFSYGSYGSCINGVKTRTGTRTCTNPAPANGGRSCSGPTVNIQRTACGSQPVDGGWTDFVYEPFTTACIDGVQSRVGTRTCTNPAPANGGKDCSGLRTKLDTRPCNTFDKLKGDKCPASLILTQNLRAPSYGEGYIRNGKYDRYTGGIVKEAHILQKHLNRLGFNAGKVDGIIGPNTRAAIKRMQKLLRTAQDGYVGPITRELLNNSCDKDEKEEPVKVTEKPKDVKCARYLTKAIEKGSQDVDEIKKLQIFLNKYEGEKLDVSGIYDQQTIEAVNRYQKKYAKDILSPWKLTKPTGTVMSTFRGHVNKRYREANNCLGVCQGKFTEYLTNGSRGEEVKKVQRFLKDLGFYEGDINGYYGKTTKKSVRRFQNENWIDVLKPWGIPCQCGTGYWYQTTRNFANRLIGCAKPLPKLNHGKTLQCVIDHFPEKYKR